jgi:hypothetical protein
MCDQSDNCAPSGSTDTVVSVDANVGLDVGSVTGILDDSTYGAADSTAIAVNADICADPLLNVDAGLCLGVDVPDIGLSLDHLSAPDHFC